MRFISRIDNPFSRVEPTCPSVRIEIKLFPIVSDGVYWTTLNSRKRLRNFYHSIGEIKIVLFRRFVLKQHDELKASSKYTAVA